MKKLTITLSLIIAATQVGISAPTGSTILLYSIAGLCVLLAVISLILVATNVMNLEAHKYGIDITKENFSAVPGIDDFVPEKQEKH